MFIKSSLRDIPLKSAQSHNKLFFSFLFTILTFSHREVSSIVNNHEVY